jgi:hypothetical protein
MIEHLPRTICYAIVVDGDIAGLVADALRQGWIV